tara:strand:+ start:247 stop:600 length:354 start_codon:yes stop_codon:yes gene_type:complete
MLNLTLFYKVLGKRGFKYVYVQFVVIIFFAFAYWFSDLLLSKYPELCKKYGLGTIEQKDTFYSYLYFSFITQTTVGFGGTLPGGGNVVTTNSNLLKFFSIAQLASIVIITAWSLVLY